MFWVLHLCFVLSNYCVFLCARSAHNITLWTHKTKNKCKTQHISNYACFYSYVSFAICFMLCFSLFFCFKQNTHTHTKQIVIRPLVILRKKSAAMVQCLMLAPDLGSDEIISEFNWKKSVSARDILTF